MKRIPIGAGGALMLGTTLWAGWPRERQPSGTTEPVPASAQAAPAIQAAVAPQGMASPAAATAPAPSAMPSDALRTDLLKLLQAPVLVAHQIGLERWDCQPAQCEARLRAAPGAHRAPGSANGAFSDAFQEIQKLAAEQQLVASMTQIAHPPEGPLMALRFTPRSAEPRVSLTASEIAKLRADTLKDAERQRAVTP